MKRFACLLALAAASLPGCGKPQPPTVQFDRHAPYYSKDKDERTVKAFCPFCLRHVTWQAPKCPLPIAKKKKCNGEIAWADTIRCGYCRGTGACPVCAAHHMTDFKCFHCKGRGYNDLNEPCPNCEGAGTCPLCRKDPGKCDYCKDGQYAVKEKKGVQDPEIEEYDEGSE